MPNHTHPEPQPPPPPPAKLAAKIESFTVSPAAIKKGEKATLTWSTADAVSIALKERNGQGVSGVDSSTLSGEIEIEPAETTTYVLHAVGEGGSAFAIAQLRVADEALEIPEAPLLLSAVPDQIVAGQKTALVWSGPGPVSITDDKNNTIATGSAVSGSLEISPVETTTYTAKSGKQEVSIEVKVKPVINRFFATPAGASAGQTITLHWLTAGATEVKLSERNRTALFTAPDNQRNEGSFEDTIPADLPNGTVLEYTLTAQNGDGVSTQTLSFTVSVVPTITEFKGPAVLTKGGSTSPKLTWKTTGAARITILSGAKGTTPNDVVFIAPSSQLTSGSVDLPLPTESTDYELVAEASQGGQAVSKHTLEIVDLPEIVNFTINPPTITNPGETAQVQWTTTGGTSVILAPVGASSLFSSNDPVNVATGTATITAGNTSEFELVVTNDAGDVTRQVQTLTVASPIGFIYDPPLAVPGQQVAMEWDFPGATAVYGAPVGETDVGVEPFIDLTSSATAAELTTLGSTATARAEKIVFPDGFKFRHFGTNYGEVFVTNRGWISFADSVTAGNITAAIPDAATPNNFIAAWAGETLSNGKVLWELQGSAPNRELVIQWDKFSTSTAGSSLTFELILFESGMLQMRYKEMTGAGSTITIGVEDASGTVGYKSTVAAPPAANDAITFNGAQLPSGSVTFTAGNTSVTHSLLVDLGTAKVPVQATLTVIRARSVQISEIMYKPVSGATAGQWIELHNMSGGAIDLQNFSLKTTAETHPLPSRVLADGEMLVIGQSATESENGGTAVDLVIPTLILGDTGDTVELLLGSGVVDGVIFDDASLQTEAGHSISANPGLFPKFCVSHQAYGTFNSFGTPGVAGESCGGYVVSRLPGAFQDIWLSGTRVMRDETSSRILVTFPSGFVFPFEGIDRTSMLIGSGYLSFDVAKGASTADEFAAPPAIFPDPNGLRAVIAPKWEAYGYNSIAYSDVYTRLVENPDGDPSTPDSVYIVQWEGLTPTGNTEGFQIFQCKLFENGDIEFHYSGLYPYFDWWFEDWYGLDDGSKAVVGLIGSSGYETLFYSNREPLLTHTMSVQYKSL